MKFTERIGVIFFAVYCVTSLVLYKKFVSTLQREKTPPDQYLRTEKHTDSSLQKQGILAFSEKLEELRSLLPDAPQTPRIGFPYNPQCKKEITSPTSLYYVVSEHIYIYSAFYDNRTATPIVRMLVTIRNMVRQRRQVWCHFNDKNKIRNHYKSVLATFGEIDESRGKEADGWIISCRVPDDLKSTPCTVIVTSGKRSKNPKSGVPVPVMITRYPDSNVKKEIGLCVPPLYGNISSQILVEFIELNQILGVDNIIIYVHNFTEEMRKVFEFYSSSDVVTVVPWTLPMIYENKTGSGQTIAVNDCLYRNMAYFKYLVFIDLDEFIIPHGNLKNLQDVLKLVQTDNYCGYSFVSVYFDISEYINEFGTNRRNTEEKNSYKKFRSLIATTRTVNFIKNEYKLIVMAEKVFDLSMTKINKCWPPSENRSVKHVHEKYAYVHHYSKCNSSAVYSCKNNMVDKTVPQKYSNDLLTNHPEVMKLLDAM